MQCAGGVTGTASPLKNSQSSANSQSCPQKLTTFHNIHDFPQADIARENRDRLHAPLPPPGAAADLALRRCFRAYSRLRLPGGTPSEGTQFDFEQVGRLSRIGKHRTPIVPSWQILRK